MPDKERAYTRRDSAHISTERAHSRAHNSTEGAITRYVRARTLTYNSMRVMSVDINDGRAPAVLRGLLH